jgi:hypothetical protein
MINGMIILNCGRLTSSAGPNPSVMVVPCYCAAAITAIAATTTDLPSLMPLAKIAAYKKLRNK